MSARPAALALASSLLAIGCAAVLTACSGDDDQDLVKARRIENELMHDIGRAGPAIEDRLRNRVELYGSIVLLKDGPGSLFLSLHAMPAHAPWSVKCGLFGLTVAFGSTGEFGSGANVHLSGARFDERTCKVLAPLTASKIMTILDGQ